MKSITHITALLALTLSTAFAQQTFNYPQENPIFEISYPDDWVVSADSETIEAGPEDNSVSTVLMALDGQDLDSAIDGAAAGLEESFQNFEFGDPEEGEINGMAVVLVNGSGESNDGGNINMTCAIFTPDGDTFFMLFLFTASEISDQHIADINSILNSIQP